VNAAFKYDHLIQGWDFTARSNDFRLMLENLVFFATFIPDKVQEWIDAQFVDKGIEGGTGVAQYETPDDQYIARNSNDIPQASEKIAKNKIEFKDNWVRCGTLTWVSGVIVDGEEKEMYYQIYAGSASDFRGENDDGVVKTIVILGKYVYPAGSSIYHDPMFEASSFLFSIRPDNGGALFAALAIGLISCESSVLAMITLKNRRKKYHLQYNVPPEYRRY
jgi:hypothetical protein